MSDIALARSRPDEALAFLRRALARAPDDIEALLLTSLACPGSASLSAR